MYVPSTIADLSGQGLDRHVRLPNVQSAGLDHDPGVDPMAAVDDQRRATWLVGFGVCLIWSLTLLKLGREYRQILARSNRVMAL